MNVLNTGAPDESASTEFNLGRLIELTADRVPDRPAIISAGSTLTYSQLIERARRFGRFLADRGLGVFAARATLANHESGQDLVAQYLHNGPAYLEVMIGAYLGRLAPFNVNYRYVAEELRYLLSDASPRAIVYHAEFAPSLSAVLADIPPVEVLIQVSDSSGHELLPGAIHYEEALASVQPDLDCEPGPDDLYVLYTGGTTGMPKGVLWRQADIAVAGVGLVNRRHGREWNGIEERLAAIRSNPLRVMALAPFMHGAAQWVALQALAEGNTLVLPDRPRRFDPADVWDTIEREAVNVVSIVGDAFALPLAEEIEARPREVSSLQYLISGGAALQPNYKARLLAAVASLTVIDTIGSSETGSQGRRLSDTSEAASDRTFDGGESTIVLSEDLSGIVEPGSRDIGWLASRGRVPLGYLGDPTKTAATFPVVGAQRHSITGDRARVLQDGTIDLLGRDAVTINSGGEKIFAEEVEAALKAHPGVRDAVVCGRSSEKWGSEVVAVVAAASPAPSLEELRDFCGRYIARYKVPRAVYFVDSVYRSPNGKADYRWAMELVTGELTR